MRRIVLFLLVVGVIFAGCSQNKQNAYSDLFTQPGSSSTNNSLVVSPSGNVTVHNIPIDNSSINRTLPSHTLPIATLAPQNWLKYRLIYARVGWGLYIIHPMIIAFGNNTSRYEVWLNKSVQTTKDVLRYIKGQRWVWINWSTKKLFVNHTYFNIIAWRSFRMGSAIRTKYWNQFWEKEIASLNNTSEVKE